MTQPPVKHIELGYLFGESLMEAFRRGKAGSALTRTLKINDGLWHCHSKDGIEFQLERALAETQTSAFDTLFLSDPQVLAPAIGSPERYFEALRESLETCRSLKDRGLIRSYGFSSSKLSDLRETLVALKPHGFLGASAIATELSLFSPDLAELENLKPLKVFVKRSLEPYIDNGRVSLVEQKTKPESSARSKLEKISESLRALKETEKQTRDPWASRIERQFFEIGDRETWQRILADQIEPSFSSANPETANPLRECLSEISSYFSTLEYERRSQIEARMNDVFSAERPLDEKALALLDRFAKSHDVELSFDLDPLAVSALERPGALEFARSLESEKTMTALREFFS